MLQSEKEGVRGGELEGVMTHTHTRVTIII